MKAFWTLLSALVCAATADAQMTNRSTAFCGTGSRSAVGSLTNLSAVGQPGGILKSGTAGAVNQAGYLNRFLLKPALDTDHDGAADEWDVDNDSDGLQDGAELDGSAFQGCARTDPNRSDTDGDGMNDAAEAAGMFDPLDPSHKLEILGLTCAAGDLTLRWIGKGGGALAAVLGGDRPGSGSVTNIVVRGSWAGGDAPWFKATNSCTWTAATNAGFFVVRQSP